MYLARRARADPLTAKAKLQERERLIRAHAQSTATTNAHGKRPLQAIPADSTSPTAPNSRTTSSRLGATPGSSKALQDALASGSGAQAGVKHFQGPDLNAPLKNMIGDYVE